MILPLFIFVSALLITGVGAYFSIVGLSRLFAGAVASVVVMGVVLELGKISGALWLHRFWSESRRRLIKAYLLSAVVVLVLISSMGIFGYLSAAHWDQKLEKDVSELDVETIDIQVEQVESQLSYNKQRLSQMDAVIDGYIQRQYFKRSLEVKAEQAPVREEIELENRGLREQLSKLKQDRAKSNLKVREHEIEIGPLKYIAELIYSENESTDKAIKAVILALVFVFDPLAVCLLIASQMALFDAKRPKPEPIVEAVPKDQPLISDSPLITAPEVTPPELPQEEPMTRSKLRDLIRLQKHKFRTKKF